MSIPGQGEPPAYKDAMVKLFPEKNPVLASGAVPSGSFSGSDFQITILVPIDDDQRANLVRYYEQQMAVYNPGYAYGQTGPQNLVASEAFQLYSQYKTKRDFILNHPYIENLVEITDLSISSRRSKPPVRRLGEVSPIDHGKGVRTVAGSMIMILLKNDPLIELYNMSYGDPMDNSPFYIDRIPPFHMIISATNEQGYSITSRIAHVELVDFGTVLSASDMFTEFQYSWTARYLTPFADVDVHAQIRKLVNMSSSGTPEPSQVTNLKEQLDRRMLSEPTGYSFATPNGRQKLSK